MPTTDNPIRRRHEKTKFTPAEIVSALQAIGGMSPIELLTAGYINIPAVNDAQAAQAGEDRVRMLRAWGVDYDRDTLAGVIV